MVGPGGVAEEELGRPWKTMLETHGDWGRDGTMLVAVRYGRRRLVEVVRETQGLHYAAAAQAVKRFAAALEADREKFRIVARVRAKISLV